MSYSATSVGLINREQMAASTSDVEMFDSSQSSVEATTVGYGGRTPDNGASRAVRSRTKHRYGYLYRQLLPTTTKTGQKVTSPPPKSLASTSTGGTSTSPSPSSQPTLPPPLPQSSSFGRNSKNIESEPQIDVSSTPSSPVILSSPLPSPSIQSSHNTSALVRTISNGSTFGPISNCLLNILSLKSSTSTSSNPTDGGSSPTTSPSTSDTPNPMANHSTATCATLTGSNNTITSTSPNMATVSGSNNQSATVNKSVMSSSVNVTSSSNLTTTTTILSTSPVQTILPSVELPVMFGENYILTCMETSNLHKCFDTRTMEEYCCKVVLSKDYQSFLSGHVRMDGHSGINQVQKIIVGRVHTFILFPPSYGDLQSYVRNKKRLRESEAMPLFQQVMQIVADCHSNGIILRDLKLQKFIFSNKERTKLKLETLENATLFDDEDDTLSDMRGCPAYVCPEMLNSRPYSGKAADCWSLGVILYTMLVGWYPFRDPNPSVVMCKILRGNYYIPESLSRHAKCLVRSLMLMNPELRLTADDALTHRWFVEARSPVAASSIISKRYGHYHHHHHHHHSYHLQQQLLQQQQQYQHHQSSASDHHQPNQPVDNGVGGNGSHSPITTSYPSSLRISPLCCINAANSNSLDDQVVPDLTD